MPRKESNEFHPKVDPLISGQEPLRILKKPLSADAMVRPTHRGYMEELDKQRKIEEAEENNNPPGQPKP